MNVINWLGVIFVIAFSICSLFYENKYLCGIFFVFGTVVLIIGKCTVNETPKYRVFLPTVQLIVALMAILYGSVEELNKCGILYSVFMCLGGLLMIVGLKIPRILFHRIVASPLAMLLFFSAFQFSYRINMFSALVSGIMSAFVIFGGIVFSDRNWYAHFLVRKH